MVQERNHGEEAVGIEGSSDSGMGGTLQLISYGVQGRTLE